MVETLFFPKFVFFFCDRFLPKEGGGVYSSRWCYGSPAHKYSLGCTNWIIEVTQLRVGRTHLLNINDSPPKTWFMGNIQAAFFVVVVSII